MLRRAWTWCSRIFCMPRRSWRSSAPSRCWPGAGFAAYSYKKTDRQIFLHPILRLQKLLIQFRFCRARLRMPVITPFHQRRHGHQDGFGAAVALQTEDGAAVDHQVEFDIAAAPVKLEIALAFAVRSIHAALENRHVGRQKEITDALLDGEGVGEIRFTKVVEENAADAARLVAVLEVKIFVAPFFVFRMQVITEWRDRIFAS